MTDRDAGWSACHHSSHEHRATARLTRATWALCLVTAGLLLATCALAFATLKEKQRVEGPARQATEEVATQQR